MQQEQKENGPALWVMNVKPGEKFTVRRYGERDINVRASVGNEGATCFSAGGTATSTRTEKRIE